VSFVDTEHDWILVGVESSSNFSVGELWRTVDGGTTWVKLAAPNGGAIHFVTLMLGFLAGGSLGEKLFITRDGGSSWQAQTVAPPQPLAQGTPVYAVPSFSNDKNGVLPVTFSGAPASGGCLLCHGRCRSYLDVDRRTAHTRCTGTGQTWDLLRGVAGG
jgi:hypothetical protein